MVQVATPPALDTSNYVKHTSGNPIQRKLIDRFHEVILEKIVGLNPASFLDAGCGEGFVAELLLERLPALQLTGFDHNPDSVAMAQEKNPTCSFQAASIYEIPFADRSFDVVGCFEVLEHMVEPSKALAELGRVASRSMVISVPISTAMKSPSTLKAKANAPSISSAGAGSAAMGSSYVRVRRG